MYKKNKKIKRNILGLSLGIAAFQSLDASAALVLDDSNFSPYTTTGVNALAEHIEITTTEATPGAQIDMSSGGIGLSATGNYTITVNSTNEFVIRSTAVGSGYDSFTGARGNILSKSDLKFDIVDGRGIYLIDGNSGIFEKKVTINSSGEAIGLLVDGRGTADAEAHFEDELIITATGDNSKGIVSLLEVTDGPSLLDLIFDKNVTIRMSGSGSDGISTRNSVSLGSLTEGFIHFKDGLDVETNDGVAIFSDFDNSEIRIDGTSRIVSNGTQSAIFTVAGTVSVNGKSEINGNMLAAREGVIDLNLLSGSSIKGTMDNYVVTDVPGFTAGEINLDFQGTGSIWELTGTSYVNTLNGTGIFKLDTNVVSQTGSSLYITDVDGASGTHGLIIADTGVGSAAETYEHPVVITNGGDAIFSMDNGVLANVGAFQYDVKKNGDNWVLYRATNRLAPTAAASLNDIRAGYLMNYSETQSLMQRMGELRNETSQGNVWGKLIFGEFDVNSDAQLSSFHQTFKGVQVGADKNLRQGKDAFYLGGMFGYTNSNQSYGTGRGEIDSYYLGAYGTYVAESGLYVDTVLKYGWQDQEFRLRDNSGNLVRGDTNNNGFTISSEIGYRHYLDKETKKGWYLEPQGQLTVGRFSSDDFRTSNGMNVEFDSYNMVLGRAGLQVGYGLTSGSNPINVYGKASYNHEFSGNLESRINGDRISTDLGSSWWTYGLGVAAQIGMRHHVYLDIERANGTEFTQLWKLNGGYRFNW